jgi:NADPH:quinone reductase-like Zn-dependent oxidoreductase
VVRDEDVVLDTIGGETQDRSWQVIKPGGVLVGVVGLGAAGEEAAEQRGVRVASVNMPADTRDILKRISELIDAGELAAEVGRVFSLEEARQAHELSETGHGRGRIVLHVA